MNSIRYLLFGYVTDTLNRVVIVIIREIRFISSFRIFTKRIIQRVVQVTILNAILESQPYSVSVVNEHALYNDRCAVIFCLHGSDFDFLRI
ncbi:unnamed protein product [Haemonchus placei]|uniref:Secreted protein n=1 Tax=Haemonchus placei TaxID=6290 RepID=A0A0N4W5N5_HAEPC|nr:unnamed protein product [Haemonchus placei]